MFNKKGKSTVSSAKLFSASRHKRLVKHVFIRYNKYCPFSGNDYPLLCILREFYPFVLYTLFLLASRAFRQIQNKNLIGGLHLPNRLAFVDGSLTLPLPKQDHYWYLTSERVSLSWFSIKRAKNSLSKSIVKYIVSYFVCWHWLIKPKLN